MARIANPARERNSSGDSEFVPSHSGNRQSQLLEEKIKDRLKKCEKSPGDKPHGAEQHMPIIGDEEIFARIHKFKLFRKEGNLYIDLYEVILGKPPHRFIAVPNLLIKEAEEKYFGVGDSRKAALKDCLKKIKDTPIQTLVPLGPSQENEKPYASVSSEQTPESTHFFHKMSRLFSKRL